MSRLFIYLFTAIYLCGSFQNLLAENIFTIETRKDSYAEYIDYTANFDPLSNQPVPKENIWRHLAEHLIFVSAPTIGGCDCKIELKPVTSDMSFIRSIREVSEGRFLSFPVATFPKSPIHEEFPVLISDPILEEDQFFVGLFTHENRDDILSLTDLDEIRKLKFVVVENWPIDIQVLEERGFTTILAADWGSALRIIKAGRGDVLMQPFGSGPTMSFTDDASGETFIPIPNIKMPFNHSRNYMVSPNHPDGEEFLKYLNEGIRIMKENGRLEEYFIAAGVIDPRIADFDEL